MIKGFERIKELSVFTLLVICAVSALISWAVLNNPLKAFIDSMMPPYVLEIEVLEDTNPAAIPNREVWINRLSLGGEEDMGLLFSHSANSGFEFRRADDYGYSNDVITNVSGESGAIRFAWPKGGADSVEFQKQDRSGIIQLTLSRGDDILMSERIDLFSSDAEDYLTIDLDTTSNAVPRKYTAIRWGAIVLAALIIFTVLCLLVSGWVAKNTENDCAEEGDDRESEC